MIGLPSPTAPISHLLLLKPGKQLPRCLLSEKPWSECATSVDGNFESCASTPGCGQPVMDNSNHRPLHPGRPYHPEPPRGPPAPSWVPSEHIHPQGPQAYPVQNHAPRPRAYHPPGRASTSLDSYQMGFGGGPSLPNPIPQGYTLPHPHGGLYLPHQGHWVSHSMQAPIPPNHGGMMNMSGGLSYELMPTPPAVGSGYPSQPPQGMGLHANTGLEANTQLQSRYIQQSGIIPMSYYVAPPPGHQIGQIGLDPYPAGSTTYNRRLGYTGSSASSRVPRAPNSYSPSCK